MRSFRVRPVELGEVPASLQFHIENLTDHMVQRSLEDLKRFARDRSLLEVVETHLSCETPVGLCYIMFDEAVRAAQDRVHEFGGLFTVPECRGFGLATVLGKVAIANHYANVAPPGVLIAHVVETNLAPVGVLRDQLGFVLTDKREYDLGDKAPRMPRNANGKVDGLTYTFDRRRLAGIADWMEQWDEDLSAPNNSFRVRVDLPTFKADRWGGASVLNALAKECEGSEAWPTPLQ